MTEAERHLTSLLMRLTLTRREAHSQWRQWSIEQGNSELSDAVVAVENALDAALALANRVSIAEDSHEVRNE